LQKSTWETGMVELIIRI